MRRALIAVAIGVTASATAFACVDPAGDYESYVDSTKDIRGVTPDAGPSDGAPFEAGDTDINAGKRTYFGNCLPTIVAGSPEMSLMFYGEVTFNGGKIDLAIHSLKETATKLSKSETVGAPQIANGVTLESDSTFVMTIGDVSIPGSSQRIGPSDLVLKNVSYQGRVLGNERLCAELQGEAVAPLTATLDKSGDFCVWIAMPDGADLPKYKDASGKDFVGIPNEEYHCP
ncbi:MAG: hypothetical protein HYV09_35385 [Deltaproteobacteria bacterium]|nr:hypothetical protein [Deltaproteobacteria bacterium]